MKMMMQMMSNKKINKSKLKRSQINRIHLILTKEGLVILIRIQLKILERSLDRCLQMKR